MSKHLEALIELLRIPSVSTDPAHKADVARAAAWLAERLEGLGFVAEIVPTPGHPVVYAERMVDPKAPTVLVYGHYDVQPPDPLELWESPPFEPEVREGRIYARGASDDKGQLYIHVAAAEELGHNLPVNLKFVIEGEEEIGSTNLFLFLKERKEQLAADVVLVSDGAMFAPGWPTLTYGLRGLAYLEVEVEGTKSDLHSGIHGGAVPNAAHAAAEMIAALKSPEGWIRIPGFYDRVRPLDPEERAMWMKLPFDETAYREQLGATKLPGEPGYGVLERRWARPTLDVNGMWSGWTGPGSKTVIPAKAGFKFSMRLVPDQDPDEIAERARRYLEAIVPEGYRLKVTVHQGARPVLVDRHAPPVRIAAKALEAAFGRETIFTREGGSIPIVGAFVETLEAPVVLMGFGLHDDNLHAPNEKFELENFEKGIQAVTAFHRLFAREAGA